MGLSTLSLLSAANDVWCWVVTCSPCMLDEETVESWYLHDNNDKGSTRCMRKMQALSQVSKGGSLLLTQQMYATATQHKEMQLHVAEKQSLV